MTGARLVKASLAGTGAFTLTAVAAAATAGARPVATAVALVLFATGTVLFLVAYAIAVGRSRTDAIGIGGLFFLAGPVAPRREKALLLGALAAQVVVAAVSAAIRPFTSLAFGTLVPTYGLALVGLWAARHGRFPARGRPGPGGPGRRAE
ncbi:MAG: hypothetical protein ACRD0D_04865 [Acidimicrobiales bacterium]